MHPAPATFLPFAMGLAQLAAHITQRSFRSSSLSRTTKSSSWDFVTEADQASEAAIVAAIRATYPDHHIVGEEGGGQGAPAEQAALHWIIDPIDGTSNYAQGIPYYSISIALADAQHNPLLGVVYAPALGELYAATLGSGATCNGQPIHISEVDSLRQAILITGFAYDRQTNPDHNGPQVNAFLPHVRDLRRFGSAALDLCYVAAGRADGFWERAINPWDVLAGALIVREAGGQVTDYTGQAAPLPGPDGRIMASNGLIHQAMQDTLRASYGG